MKKHHIHTALLFIVLNLLFVIGDAQNWQWIKQSTITNGEVVSNSIAMDVAGNYFITGENSSNSPVFFDTCQLSHKGGFVAKYDKNGNCISVFSLRRAGKSIATDLFGNIFITGSAYNDSAFISKYDVNGLLVWEKLLAISYTENTGSLTSDSSGSVYVTGVFSHTVAFDTITLSTSGNMAGFIAKFDSTGNCFWAKKIASINPTTNSISIDANRNSYITGQFSGQISFDTTTLTCLGAHDIFIAKYNNVGHCVWAQRAGGINEGGGYSQDKGYAIASTQDGNVYVTGSFMDTALFGTTQMIGRAGNDVFVAKYNTDGGLIWVNPYGIYYDNEGYSIAVDAMDNCYVGGRFVNTIAFGNTVLHGDNNTYDLFVAKLDADGNSLWAAAAGSTSWNDVASGVVLDGNEVIATGIFTGPAPAYFGNDSLVGIGNGNVFVAKLGSYSGLTETANNTTFTIFPNPNSTSPLTISIDETLLGSNLSITDITGREVLHSAVQIRNPQFDIRNFLPGVYMVSVTAVDGRKAVKKLLIE